MMAFDRGSPPPTLGTATVDALRTTLARSVAHGSHADDLRDVLCKASDEAREKGIQAEQLLVTLKEIWYSLPGVTSAGSAGSSNVLLQELISRCIQEYYSL